MWWSEAGIPTLGDDVKSFPDCPKGAAVPRGDRNLPLPQLQYVAAKTSGDCVVQVSSLPEKHVLLIALTHDVGGAVDGEGQQ